MPIHLIWGDDNSAINREIQKILNQYIDPDWESFNTSRFEGNDPSESIRALEEARSHPFGNGSRVVLLKKSPFCNGCTNELAIKLESTINLIPETTHLILQNKNKPDKRLKTTKSIQKIIEGSDSSSERKFSLPAIWDGSGQKELIQKIAYELNLEIEETAVFSLVESIGIDSTRIYTELEKLSLLAKSQESESASTNKQKKYIDNQMVKSLINSVSTNALEIANFLIKGNIGNALSKLHYLLLNGEPPLRILATLSSQVRGCLWVKLLDKDGQKDVAFIAKQAGIANPKRIYVIRKQIQNVSAKALLNLFSQLLEIEVGIKRGADPSNSFKDSLLTKGL